MMATHPVNCFAHAGIGESRAIRHVKRQDSEPIPLRPQEGIGDGFTQAPVI